jgi:hypothetical protein
MAGWRGECRGVPVTLTPLTLAGDAQMAEPNVLLDALIEEAGFSHSGFAARVNEHGRRHGIVLRYDHASVARWVRDHAVPRGEVPEIMCEILSSRLGRAITLGSADWTAQRQTGSAAHRSPRQLIARLRPGAATLAA